MTTQTREQLLASHPDLPELLRRSEVALVLGCSVRSVDRLVERGLLPVRHLGRLVRFSVEDLQALSAGARTVRQQRQQRRKQSVAKGRRGLALVEARRSTAAGQPPSYEPTLFGVGSAGVR